MFSFRKYVQKRIGKCQTLNRVNILLIIFKPKYSVIIEK